MKPTNPYKNFYLILKQVLSPTLLSL